MNHCVLVSWELSSALHSSFDKFPVQMQTENDVYEEKKHNDKCEDLGRKKVKLG